LIDGWSHLGPSIVASGNGARKDPPAKAVLSGWKRAQKEPEQSAHLKDIQGVLGAIRAAEFCHGQAWFTVPWLFAKNKCGEFNLSRLMSGAYNQKGSNGNANGSRKPMPVGPSHRHPADRSGPGQI
jgi:hypothetical protein